MGGFVAVTLDSLDGMGMGMGMVYGHGLAGVLWGVGVGTSASALNARLLHSAGTYIGGAASEAVWSQVWGHFTENSFNNFHINIGLYLKKKKCLNQKGVMLNIGDDWRRHLRVKMEQESRMYPLSPRSVRPM